jgi:hypothetical protein
LKAYYTKLQDEWVSYFENQPLVKKENDYINVRNIMVLDKELSEACETDSELLDALYTLLSKEANDLTLPEKTDLIYWSRCTYEWYRYKINPHEITLSKVCQITENTPIEITDIEWLLKLCLYLKVHPHPDIDLKKLVPNEQLTLLRVELVKPINFNSTYRAALQILVPEEVNNFIHKRFYLVLDDAKDYGFDNAKKAITIYLTSLENKSVALKNAILAENSWEKEDYEGAYLNELQIKAILDIYKMLLPLDGGGFSTKAFNLLTQFYEYTPSTDEHLDRNDFDIRTCYTALLNDALYRFTLFEDKSTWRDWNLEMVKVLYDFKDANNFLHNYLIYRNQIGKYCFACKLKKEKEMPPRLKEIYDIICRGITDENNSKSICHELVAKEYEDFFIESGELSGSDLANEIQEPFAEKEVRTIENNPHQKLIIEIIELLNDKKEGPIWRKLFATINNIRAQLMLSVINSPQKCESIFQIMKVQDEKKLNLIAELSKIDNLEHIIELGKMAVDSEIQEKNDFAFREQLGLYVEHFLLSQLKDVLNKDSLKVKVADIQGGQDLIVFIEDTPIYYIEVKSRWQSDRSVLMSTSQHRTSYEQKDNYALCAVDMSDYDRELAKQHQYPTDVQEIISRIKVLDNIGVLNERLKDAVEDKNDEMVHIANGYQVLVPQKIIAEQGKTLEIFFEELKQYLKSKIKPLIELYY